MCTRNFMPIQKKIKWATHAASIKRKALCHKVHQDSKEAKFAHSIVSKQVFDVDLEVLKMRTVYVFKTPNEQKTSRICASCALLLNILPALSLASEWWAKKELASLMLKHDQKRLLTLKHELCLNWRKMEYVRHAALLHHKCIGFRLQHYQTKSFSCHIDSCRNLESVFGNRMSEEESECVNYIFLI